MMTTASASEATIEAGGDRDLVTEVPGERPATVTRGVALPQR